ncbi:MAG: hypothetical protein GXP30_12405 [Verrucomicrobia bacterium]|nr:hypothetical protein [Verrucomicrobiota bacterium]
MKNIAIRTLFAFLTILGLTLFLPGGPANAANPPAAAPRKNMVQVDLPLGHANATQLKALLPDLLSKDARYIILNSKRIVRITDYPDNIEALRGFLKAMDVAPTNVRIEITHRSMNQGQSNSARLGGQVITPFNNRTFINGQAGNTPGVIRRVTTPGTNNRLPIRTTNQGRIILPNRGSVNVDLLKQRGTSDRLDRMFTLVRSGKESVIEVVRDVPMVDFFTRYIVGNVANFNVRGPGTINGQFVAGGTFELPEFRWEKVGSQLVVRPIVQGNLITIEITPRFAAVVIANPQKLTERRLNDFLTGEDQYVTLTSMKTTVTVQSGQAITIGSFPAATAEFNRYFRGGSLSSGSGGGSITLKATIQ